jgi:23S rRNA (pseudouridine1915-N3)-methyltransferase
VKLDLIVVGRLKSGPERDLCERYAERLKGVGRSVSLEGPRITELSESPARRDADRKSEEGEAILTAHLPGFRLIALDEIGQSLDSESFAAKIGRWRDVGAPGVTFVIGGADGLAETVRAKADLVISFGKMTMPHQIVRALVLEQLYRAATILSGHPYHRV